MSPKVLFSSLLLLPLMALAPASSALAQKGPQITPFFGLRSGGAFRIQDTTRSLDFRSAPTFGFAFNYGLTDNFELEVMWSRQKTAVELGPTPTPGETAEIAATTWIFRRERSSSM